MKEENANNDEVVRQKERVNERESAQEQYSINVTCQFSNGENSEERGKNGKAMKAETRRSNCDVTSEQR